MQDVTVKTRETRLRRALARDGYQLRKSRSRDRGAFERGGYSIVHKASGRTVAGAIPHPFAFSLDDVAMWARP